MNLSPIEIGRRQIALYELSKQPSFEMVFEAIEAVVARRACDLPATPDEKVRWETFSIVSYVGSAVAAHIQAEIRAGEQLARQELLGDAPDAQEDRSGDGRPRA